MTGYTELRSTDGSVWSRGAWREGVQVTLREIAGKAKGKGVGERQAPPVMCVEYLFREMDNLRYASVTIVFLLIALLDAWGGKLQLVSIHN